MNIARDTRIATYVFSEPANFLLYYNNIRTFSPPLLFLFPRKVFPLSLSLSFRRRKREGESRQFSKDRKGRGDGNKTINRARAATYGRAREGLGEENGGPCQRLPPLARKNGSCRGYRYRGPLFSRHPSRRRGERERGPSVPKQGNFRGGGERREARTNETTARLLDERERKEENRERRRRWGRRVARTTISVAVAAATATAIVVYIPPTTGIERRSRWQ